MIMAVKTTRYDTAEYLDSEEKIAAYVDAVLEDGDPALVTRRTAAPNRDCWRRLSAEW